MIDKLKTARRALAAFAITAALFVGPAAGQPTQAQLDDLAAKRTAHEAASAAYNASVANFLSSLVGTVTPPPVVVPSVVVVPPVVVPPPPVVAGIPAAWTDPAIIKRAEAVAQPVWPTDAPKAALTPAVAYPKVTEKTGLSVIIAGVAASADAGDELGDYTAPSGAFVQRCIRVKHPSGLTIYFRPDRNSSRVEVVFENWLLKTGPPAHIPAYSVDIMSGATKLATVAAPQHYWGSRWRWQSAPRPMLHSPADLVAARLVLPFRSGIKPLPAPRGKAEVYTPLTFAGLTANMGTTGEREDIGPQTEAVAEWLVSGSTASRDTMLAQAEAAGSWQIHRRDEDTGAPMSKERWPFVTAYWNQAGSAPIKMPLLPIGDWLIYDEAHAPNNSYVPFLLTEDPYHLEEMQFALSESYWSNQYRWAGVLGNSMQSRGMAWASRNMFQVVKVTPDVVPGWLLPKAYFASRMNATLKQITDTWVQAKAPAWPAFSHMPLGDGGNAFWQDDFHTTMMGYGVLLGFESWRPYYDWKLGTARARLNGTSGWPRTQPIQYYLQQTKAFDGLAPITSWADAAKFYTEAGKTTYTPIVDTADGKLAPSDPSYRSYLLGNLSVALALGYADVKPLNDWYAPQVGGINHRWSF